MKPIARVLFVALMLAGLGAARADDDLQVPAGKALCNEAQCLMRKQDLEQLRAERDQLLEISRQAARVVELKEEQLGILRDRLKRSCAAKLEVIPDRKT